MNIQEYCDTLNLEIVVRYYPNQEGRWCVKFDNCETKDMPDSVGLLGAHGNAKTIHAAMEDYLKKIRGKLLVVNAFSDTKRREYMVPMSLTV